MKKLIKKGVSVLSPLLSKDGVALIAMRMWVAPHPNAISDNFIMPRNWKSKTKALANCKPLPRAPAVSCVPDGGAPAPSPPARRGN